MCGLEGGKVLVWMEETPQTCGGKTKKQKQRHNVPSPPQSTWELALCAVPVLNQGWNVTQTLVSPGANSLHFWNGLTENQKYILCTRIPFSLYHPGCLFCLYWTRSTHFWAQKCCLSKDGDPFSSVFKPLYCGVPSVYLEVVFWVIMGGGWHSRVSSSKKRWLWNSCV